MKTPTVYIKADILRSWLQVTGWTKSQLAAALGVSKARVSQLFNSALEVEPSAHLIAKLLLLTRLPFDRLFIITGTGNGDTEKTLSSWTDKHNRKTVLVHRR